WGFKGFVVSDWNSIGELIAHGVASDLEQAAEKGLNAGVDMDMSANAYVTKLAGLVKQGRVKVSTIDESTRRVLRMKVAMGLFERPYTDEARTAKTLLSPEHLAVAREAAEKSFVLLKNEKDVLPLKSSQKVALIGPLADSNDDMLGEWAVSGRKEDVVTLRTSLSERLGSNLTYVEGTKIQTADESGFAAAVEAARNADAVVMAMGESRFMSGESFSRTNLNLPGNQTKLVQAVAALGKPVVLIVFSGRPLALPIEATEATAILEAWFPGVQAGPALARTLFGDASPSGRLTASFPRSVGQMPLYYNLMSTGRPARTDAPNQRFVSSYLDERTTPLFPFGHGLTYTTFEYSAPQILTKSITVADLLKRRATVGIETLVKNTGSRPGIETVQLYIRQRGTSVARPVRELKGYQRLSLNPGESRAIRFALKADDLAFWNLQMKHTV
ncbi:beta-glucosidase, partial [bacterium]